MKNEDKYYYFFNPSDGHTNKQKNKLESWAQGSVHTAIV